jgi:hypothetical protein
VKTRLALPLWVLMSDEQLEAAIAKLCEQRQQRVNALCAECDGVADSPDVTTQRRLQGILDRATDVSAHYLEALELAMGERARRRTRKTNA